jgi:hypothetical protein
MSEALQAKLDRVRKAIETIENSGQSVSYEGRNVTKADLKTLYEREAMLEKRLARKGRGIRNRGGTPL